MTTQEKAWLDQLDTALEYIYTRETLTKDDKFFLSYNLLQSHCMGFVSFSTFKLAMCIRHHYQDQEGN
jgi:hypothetical protein